MNSVSFELLRLGLRDLPVNNAIVAAEITDADGLPVTGVTQPIELNYIEGSAGNYSAIIDDAIELDKAQVYTITVKAESTEGNKAEWTQPLKVVDRTITDERKLSYVP